MKMNIDSNKVAIVLSDIKTYPSDKPYNPPVNYPEYEGDSLSPNNHIYAKIRECFFRLGLDKENYNKKAWNPFGKMIRPGMTVFIKPNTVVHEHEENKDLFSVIIHASVLRPILDYVCIALKNKGRIIVGDSQLYSSHFDKAMEASDIDPLLGWYRAQTSIPVECFDLRLNRAVRTYLYGRWGREKIEHDPRGYRFVDLGDLSYFKDIDPKRLRIAIASYKNMYKHHSNGKHEYLFPQSFLDSDVVISIPKLKTHRRTAVTLALKNFMGLPALKDSLPHFITGSVAEGGDQYINASIRKKMVTRLHDIKEANPFIPVKFVCAVVKKFLWESRRVIPFKDEIFEAMWYGNDTLWRTLLDLNRAAIYADKEGKICDTPQRNYFGLIDGIIGGEGDGPLVPDPVPAGVFIAGYNPVALDAVGATMMGFDINKIPLITKGFEDAKSKSPLYAGTKEDIRVIDGENVLDLSDLIKRRYLTFEPHPNWKGHVELD